MTIPAVHRLAATLDRDDPMPGNGDPLPIGWHFMLFPRVVRQSQLGADGKSAKLWAMDDQNALALSVTADLR
ncbi:MAG: hypothetical protein Q7R45_16420 [Sulfuricaulis sp.]|nr:hypothetical protein [Sulfuricaulis sp.]